jgi:hypothetical protein
VYKRLKGEATHAYSILGPRVHNGILVNIKRQIVCAGQDASGVWHGYFYKRGAFTQFDAPNANLTWAAGINFKGRL